MKLKNKLFIRIVSLITTLATVAASPGHDEGTTTGMMDGSWMHSGADMMGYNMWGIGWFGPLLTIGILLLVILGIICFYQEITEK